MQELVAVNMQEAARRLGVSVRSIAKLVSRNELRSRKVGRRRIIPVAELEAFVEMDLKSGRHESAKTSAKCGKTG